MDASKKQQRKNNFSTDEIRVLIEEYDVKRDIFEGKYSNTLTNIKKKSAWQEVTSKVKALGVDSTTVEEIKIKWKNLCSSAKGSFHILSQSLFHFLLVQLSVYGCNQCNLSHLESQPFERIPV